MAQVRSRFAALLPGHTKRVAAAASNWPRYGRTGAPQRRYGCGGGHRCRCHHQHRWRSFVLHRLTERRRCRMRGGRQRRHHWCDDGGAIDASVRGRRIAGLASIARFVLVHGLHQNGTARLKFDGEQSVLLDVVQHLVGDQHMNAGRPVHVDGQSGRIRGDGDAPVGRRSSRCVFTVWMACE